MLSTARCKAPGLALSSSPSVATIPTFLLPALTRSFSTTPTRSSQIGKAPLSIPPGVKFEVFGPGRNVASGKGGATGGKKLAGEGRGSVFVEGPLGR